MGSTGPAEDAEAFAELLRALKERSGLSYGALAKRLGMSTSSLHRYCNGSAVPADYAPVERLARVCRATGEELVELHRRWILADAARARRGPGPDGTELEGTGPGGAGPERMAPASTSSEPRKPSENDEPVVSGAVPPAPARPRRRRTALIASVAAAAALGTVTLIASLPFSGGDDGERTAVGNTIAAPEQRTNFQLKNVTTGRCADLPGMGKGKLDGAVLQHDCLDDWDADNQVWDFVLAQKGKGPNGRNLVVIKNKKSGLCLDLPQRGSQPSRTALSQTHCNLTLQDNQLWWVENRGGNRTFWIHNYASDQRCLEVWGEKPDFSGNDARLGIYTCSPTDDHEWRLMSKGQS
ncbi:helix-turn-helix domain-containing protein [Streptomyces sp. LZ34]